MNTQPFTRDRFTWLAYIALAYFAYTHATFGPVIPFLQEKLKLSYTIAGLHFTVFAVGMIIAGVSGASIAKRWGRRAMFWGSGGGMAFATSLLALGRHEWVTIAGAFFIGLLSAYLLVMIQATLSDKHGDRRATALTEANTIGSVGAMLAPLLIGLFAEKGLGWQSALFAGVVFWVALTLLNYHTDIPETTKDSTIASRHPLPRIFWVYWATTALLISVEWSLIAWSASFLEDAVGLERATASGLMSAFFGAHIVGRLVASQLTGRISSEALLLGAMGLALAGFMIFWLAPIPILNVAGLFITGLGVANLYPLSLATATSIAPSQANQASARISLAAGVATLLAPQTLATAADLVGIQYAMGLVVVLLGVSMGLFITTRRICTK